MIDKIKSFKKNNKGGVYTYITMMFVLITALILSSLFVTSYNMRSSSLNNIKSNSERIRRLNGYERLYQKLYENISYKGKVNYDDLGISFTVKEDEGKRENETIQIQAGNKQNFHIENETDINIEVDARRINEDRFGSAVLYLYFNGMEVFKGNIYEGNNVFKVPSYKIYDHINEEFNYGEYELYIDEDNLIVNSNISFNNEKYKELQITEEDLNKDKQETNHSICIENKYKDGNYQGKDLYIKPWEGGY